MKTGDNVLLVLFFMVISASFGSSFAQEQSIGQLQNELVSPWLVTITGQPRILVLKIAAVKVKGNESFSVDATFGFIEGDGLPIEAEVIQTAKERNLRFQTQSGNRYTFNQAANGSFEGTYTDAKGGYTRPVFMEKTSEGELQVKVTAAQAARAAKLIVKPAAEVPASCASLSGEWTGTWSQGSIGQYWLWVVDIDSHCVAKFAYLPHSRPPVGFATGEIKDGALPIVNRSTGGTSIFERHGDELWARYSNPAGGTNNAVFRKIQ